MSTPLDLTKPVQTRDGRKVRILCTDFKNYDKTVLGLVSENGGYETAHCWKIDGRWNREGHVEVLDLINTPPEPRKFKGKVWVYAFKNGCVVHGAAEPISEVVAKRLVKTELTEGEGL